MCLPSRGLETALQATILWYVDQLLGNDGDISKYTTNMFPRQQLSYQIEECFFYAGRAEML
jgi:hypothetical protein